MPRNHHAGKMSIMTENNVYECPDEERGSSDKLCLRVYENSGQFIYMPKMDDDSMEMESQNGEPTSPEETAALAEDISNYHRAQHSLVYHGDQFVDQQESKVQHDSFTPLELSDLKMEEQWEEHNSYDSSAMEDSFEENQFVESYYNDENTVTVAGAIADDKDTENFDDSDEETIATFLTAAGQRLALYAVEDSDQVFAVAVYDESGEPPTNFQFLLKSDVERLIGEGAVRTVKKPTQMRKQLLTNEPPPQPLPPLHYTELSSNDIPLAGDLLEYDDKQSKELLVATSIVNEKAQFLESYNMVENTDEKFGIVSSYSPVQDFINDGPETFEDECSRNEEKLIVRSTVDDLLLEDEESEDELTFADIEEIFAKFSPSRKRSPILYQSSRSSWQDTSIESEPAVAFYDEDSPKTGIVRGESFPIIRKTVKEEEDAKLAVITINSPMKTVKRTNLVRNNHVASSSTLLVCRRNDGTVRQEQREVSGGASLLIGSNERSKSVANAAVHGPEAAITGSPKAKRPRKQQLTSVNRGDSEIIIQPATFPNEDDDEDEGRFRRKRVYRRRRKPVRASVRYKMKTSVAKRLEKGRGGSRQVRDRAQPKKQYEIIEIDVDEEDRLSGGDGTTNKNIVEITLDESREKGSSDKENQVIMVGDSDDEEDDEDDDNEDSIKEDSSKSVSSGAASLKCEYCSRTFRQERAVKTHSRLCPKSPKNIKRLEERTLRSNDSSVPKKEFACKICHEKFDVVVVLARHVKSMHSMRKKPNVSKDTSKATASSTTAAAVTTSSKTRKERGSKNNEEKTEPGEPIMCTSPGTAAAPVVTRKGPRRRRRRRKRMKDNHPGWNGQKLHCSDCAKWFSSAALLASHLLQHGTKKSEKQIRRCQTCKKILKSKLLYIRHMRMHSRVKTLQKKLHHTRQTTVKLATLRKRGSRPRKLRSSNVCSDIYP